MSRQTARHARVPHSVPAGPAPTPPPAAWPDVQRGRHGLHRAPAAGRRVTAWTALLSAIVVAVSAGAAGYLDLDGRTSHRAEPSTGQAGGGVSPSAPVDPAATGRRPVAATPGALLALLSELLPPGKMSEPAAHRGREMVVDVRFDRGAGKGRVRVVLGPDLEPEQLVARACTVNQIREECRLLSDGIVVHLRVGRGCLQDHVTDMERPDGTQLRIEVGTCVDGRRPPRKPSGPAPPDVLSPEEAQLISVDRRWGWLMDPDLVAAGRRDFPKLGQISDPDRPVVTAP